MGAHRKNGAGEVVVDRPTYDSDTEEYRRPKHVSAFSATRTGAVDRSRDEDCEGGAQIAQRYLDVERRIEVSPRQETTGEEGDARQNSEQSTPHDTEPEKEGGRKREDRNRQEIEDEPNVVASSRMIHRSADDADREDT
jgi:hypothetical protein